MLVSARVTARFLCWWSGKGKPPQGQGRLRIDLGAGQSYDESPLRLPLVEPRQPFLLGQTTFLTDDPKRGAHATTQ